MSDERIYPDADVAIGNWTDQSLGTTNIYQAIDEISASESDWIQSESAPVASACEIGFTAPSDTVPFHGRLSYRYRKDGGTRTCDLTVQVKVGSQVVQSWTHTGIGTSWTQADQVITAELGGSKWSDIRVVWTATQGGTGGPITCQVSWAEIKTSVVKTIGTGKDYTTIVNWEANIDNTTYPTTLSVAEGQAYNQAFDESVTINASASNVIGIVLTAAAGQRHDGTEGTGARIVRTSTQASLIICSPQSNTVPQIVSWLDLDGNGNRIYNGFLNPYSGFGPGTLIRHNLIHGAAGTGYMAGVRIGAFNVVLANCAIYDLVLTASDASPIWGVYYVERSGFSFVNLSICGVTNNNGSGDAYGLHYLDHANTAIRNVVVADVGGTTSGTKACYSNSSPTNAVTQTNASSDSTAPSPITGEPVSSSVEFVSNTDPYDLHLDSGAECADAGTDLGITPAGVNLDIDGRDRDAEADTWDVGADERSAAEEIASLTVTTATVAQPGVTATYQSQLSASLDEIVAAVVQPSVTAQHTVELTASLTVVSATVSQPPVTGQGESEWAASLGVVVAVVSQPGVTATYQSELSASLVETVAQISQPAVTAQYASEWTASLGEVAAVITQPPVTATSGAEEVASLTVAVATVVEPGVTPTYQSELSALLAEAVAQVAQPLVTATYQSELSASLATAVATVEQPAVTATIGAEQIASLIVAVAAVEQPAVTATYQGVYTAALDTAVPAVAQPSVTGTYQADYTAALATVVASVSAPAVTATAVGAGTVIIPQQQLMLSA